MLYHNCTVKLLNFSSSFYNTEKDSSNGDVPAKIAKVSASVEKDEKKTRDKKATDIMVIQFLSNLFELESMHSYVYYYYGPSFDLEFYYSSWKCMSGKGKQNVC